MNYKKVLPAVVLTLGVGAQLAANAEIFKVSEVAGHGVQVAAAEHKCAAGSCGAEHKSDKKDAEHKCAAKKNAEHKCAGKKDAEHKCAGKKGAEHKCAGKKELKQHNEKPEAQKKSDAQETRFLALGKTTETQEHAATDAKGETVQTTEKHETVKHHHMHHTGMKSHHEAHAKAGEAEESKESKATENKEEKAEGHKFMPKAHPTEAHNSTETDKK